MLTAVYGQGTRRVSANIRQSTKHFRKKETLGPLNAHCQAKALLTRLSLGRDLPVTAAVTFTRCRDPQETQQTLSSSKSTSVHIARIHRRNIPAFASLQAKAQCMQGLHKLFMKSSRLETNSRSISLLSLQLSQPLLSRKGVQALPVLDCNTSFKRFRSQGLACEIVAAFRACPDSIVTQPTELQLLLASSLHAMGTQKKILHTATYRDPKPRMSTARPRRQGSAQQS